MTMVSKRPSTNKKQSKPDLEIRDEEFVLPPLSPRESVPPPSRILEMAVATLAKHGLSPRPAASFGCYKNAPKSLRFFPKALPQSNLRIIDQSIKFLESELSDEQIPHVIPLPSAVSFIDKLPVRPTQSPRNPFHKMTSSFKDSAPHPSTSVKDSAPPPSASVKDSAPHSSTSVKDSVPHSSTSVKDSAPHPSTSVKDSAPHPSASVKDSAPHPSTSVKDSAPHPSTSVKDSAPHPSASAKEDKSQTLLPDPKENMNLAGIHVYSIIQIDKYKDAFVIAATPLFEKFAIFYPHSSVIQYSKFFDNVPKVVVSSMQLKNGNCIETMGLNNLMRSADVTALSFNAQAYDSASDHFIFGSLVLSHSPIPVEFGGNTSTIQSILSEDFRCLALMLKKSKITSKDEKHSFYFQSMISEEMDGREIHPTISMPIVYSSKLPSHIKELTWSIRGVEWSSEMNFVSSEKKIVDQSLKSTLGLLEKRSDRYFKLVGSLLHAKELAVKSSVKTIQNVWKNSLLDSVSKDEINEKTHRPLEQLKAAMQYSNKVSEISATLSEHLSSSLRVAIDSIEEALASVYVETRIADFAKIDAKAWDYSSLLNDVDIFDKHCEPDSYYLKDAIQRAKSLRGE